MGVIKDTVAKFTGADQAADATRRAAEDQAAAVREAGQRAAKSAQDAAVQAGTQQTLNAARDAATSAAADKLDKPVENADVQLAGPTDPTSSAAATARKRRQTFGVGSASSGVQI
jgi:hypothetical protein